MYTAERKYNEQQPAYICSSIFIRKPSFLLLKDNNRAQNELSSPPYQDAIKPNKFKPIIISFLRRLTRILPQCMCLLPSLAIDLWFFLHPLPPKETHRLFECGWKNGISPFWITAYIAHTTSVVSTAQRRQIACFSYYYFNKCDAIFHDRRRRHNRIGLVGFVVYKFANALQPLLGLYICGDGGATCKLGNCVALDTRSTYISFLRLICATRVVPSWMIGWIGSSSRTSR